jgi:hypothetical protein
LWDQTELIALRELRCIRVVKCCSDIAVIVLTYRDLTTTDVARTSRIFVLLLNTVTPTIVCWPRGIVARRSTSPPLAPDHFLRIPELEIDDEFEWTVFFVKDDTVEDVVHGVMRELWLLPCSRGGGQIEYAFELERRRGAFVHWQFWQAIIRLLNDEIWKYRNSSLEDVPNAQGLPSLVGTPPPLTARQEPMSASARAE